MDFFELNRGATGRSFDHGAGVRAEQIVAVSRRDGKGTAASRAMCCEDAAALGLAAIYVPEEDGGSGLTRLDATWLFEALSNGLSVRWPLFLSIHTCCTLDDSRPMARTILRRGCSPSLVTMKTIAFLLPDRPGSGSDAVGAPDPAPTRTK